MTEISRNAKVVYDAMTKLGATSEDSMKSADQIMAASKIAKGMLMTSLTELERARLVTRKAREKRAGYFVSAPLTQP